MRLVTEVFVMCTPVTKGSWTGAGRPAHEKALRIYEDAVRKAVVADMDERSVDPDWAPVRAFETAAVCVAFYVHGGQSGPLWKRGDGDGDKLERATWDALTNAGALVDDAQVTDWAGQRRYAVGHVPGVFVRVTAMNLSDLKRMDAGRVIDVGPAMRRSVYGAAQ